MSVDRTVHVGTIPVGGYTAPTPSASLQPSVDYQVGVDPFVAAGLVLTPVLPNMAIPGTSLVSDADGNIIVNVAGTTLFGLTLLTGYIKVMADSCTVDRCRVAGFNEANQVLSKGLVDGNNQAATNLIVKDSTLIPASPGAAWNGIMGHDWTALRVRVRNTVDGFEVYNSNGTHKTDPVTILIDGCDIQKLVFVSPDLNHSSDAAPTKTHNDGVGIQGAGPGSSIEIRYSNIQAFLSSTVGDALVTVPGTSPVPAGATPGPNQRGGWNPKYPSQPLLQATSCVMLTPNVTSIHGLNVHDTWMDGGQVAVNGIGCSAADGGITLTNNKHGDSTVFAASAYEVAASVPSVTATGNTFTSTGAAVPLVRS